jgi:hypothetical protein
MRVVLYVEMCLHLKPTSFSWCVVHYSYLVFQNSKDGKYKGMDGKSYHLVSRINSKGKEKPKFFQEG